MAAAVGTSEIRDPTFEIAAADGEARAGTWKTADGSVATPGLLLYTRRGGLPRVTPDLRDSLAAAGAQALQLDVMHFLAQPGPEALRIGGGAKKFLAMDGLVTVATNRDCICNEYSMTGKRQDSVNVTIHDGGHKVSTKEYMTVVEALQPSAFVALADEVPHTSTTNRARASVERTAKWSEECQQWLGSSAALAGAQMLVPVMGGSHSEYRERSSQLASTIQGAGYALCGFGCGESDDERPSLIKSAVKHLPPGKVRVLSGIGGPLQILDAVESGADVFDCWYIDSLVSQGLAMKFPVDTKGTQKSADGAAAWRGEDPMKINLYTASYRTDKSPLAPGCSCFACQNHSRAYIHHLLSVHEMLGLVLLEVHNTHHMLKFFQQIRRSVLEGRLAELKASFHQLLEEFYTGVPC